MKLLITTIVSLSALVAASALASQSTISGTGTAKDGDDVIVNGIDIRLNGIAAPEDNGRKRQPGGPEATAALASLVNGQQLRCETDGSKTRGRPVAICFKGSIDIGEHQVRNGFARDCPRYSGGRYAQAEGQARAAGKNLSAIYTLPGYCN